LNGVSSGTRRVLVPLSVLLSILLTGGGLRSAPLNSSQSAAPKDYALIFGTVWGPDSRPVAGVPVRIRRASEKKFRWELVSNRTGEFAQRVPVGAQDYIIQANIKTPKGVPKPEITVHIDDNEREDVGIHLTEQQMPHRSE
jgi:hypothetical protein